MATQASSSADQKAALGEAMEVLADTETLVVQEGLFLVRRSRRASVVQKPEAPAAVTPSQVAKQIEELEGVDPLMDGETVELELAEVALPVEPEPEEAADDSVDEAPPGDAEPTEPEENSQPAEPSDDASEERR